MILCLSCNDDVLSSWNEVLTAAGHRTYLTMDASEALRVLTQEPVNVLIADC